MCSGKQPSRRYSNQNQTEDFGGLKFYNVVVLGKAFCRGEESIRKQLKVKLDQSRLNYYFFEAIETVLGIAPS